MQFITPSSMVSGEIEIIQLAGKINDSFMFLISVTHGTEWLCTKSSPLWLVQLRWMKLLPRHRSVLRYRWRKRVDHHLRVHKLIIDVKLCVMKWKNKTARVINFIQIHSLSVNKIPNILVFTLFPFFFSFYFFLCFFFIMKSSSYSEPFANKFRYYLFIY